MGRYSNRHIVARLGRVLAGQGRDRASHRPVPSPRRMSPRLTESQRSELVRRYQSGESADALAPEFGVHLRTILTHLRRAGIDPAWGGVIDRLDLDKATRLYASGLSLAKVGEVLGVSAGTVRNAFLRAGLSTRGRGVNQWSS